MSNNKSYFAMKQSGESCGKKGNASEAPTHFIPCGSERPNRKTLCQREKGHKGSCYAVIFWEDEECDCK